ncbi:MAG: 6-phosphogluconolactonase [Neisseria sp.]|nr:6-phosphogluconolactonase [Neisseria sp.]
MAATFHTFGSAIECATALADAVAQDLRAALADKNRATLAVSGGRSPVSFFQILSRADLAWKDVDIILADERIVPTNHPESNTALVREHLLQNRAAAANWLPLVEDIQLDWSPEGALQTALEHYRQPDVLVLGMGTDGHTASLFPQSPQLADGLSPAYMQPLMHITPADAPHERISMTLSAIERTPRVYLAIGGREKKMVYARAVAEKSALYPVSHVLHSRKVRCEVYYAD